MLSRDQARDKALAHIHKTFGKEMTVTGVREDHQAFWVGYDSPDVVLDPPQVFVSKQTGVIFTLPFFDAWDRVHRMEPV